MAILVVLASGVAAGALVVWRGNTGQASNGRTCYPLVDRADWMLDHEAQC